MVHNVIDKIKIYIIPRKTKEKVSLLRTKQIIISIQTAHSVSPIAKRVPAFREAPSRIALSAYSIMYKRCAIPKNTIPTLKIFLPKCFVIGLRSISVISPKFETIIAEIHRSLSVDGFIAKSTTESRLRERVKVSFIFCLFVTFIKDPIPWIAQQLYAILQIWRIFRSRL